MSGQNSKQQQHRYLRKVHLSKKFSKLFDTYAKVNIILIKMLCLRHVAAMLTFNSNQSNGLSFLLFVCAFLFISSQFLSLSQLSLARALIRYVVAVAFALVNCQAHKIDHTPTKKINKEKGKALKKVFVVFSAEFGRFAREEVSGALNWLSFVDDRC